MPSVGMRRTTRVFGARVLRSGRRLFTIQDEIKHMRRAPLAVADAEDDWIELLDHAGVGPGAGAGAGGDGDSDVEYKENGWRNLNDEGEHGVDDGEEEEEEREIKLEESKEAYSGEHDQDSGGPPPENGRWGVVYSRKRKRGSRSSMDSGGSDKRYGKKFFRKQVKKNIITENELNVDIKRKSRGKRAKIAVSKLNSQNLPSRNVGNIHRNIQKRRSSLRSRKHRNPLSFVHLKDGVPFFPIKSNPEISRSIRRANFKELKSTLAGLTHDIESASSNANILIIESDKCYREVGAIVTIEISGSNQWFLVIKRNGLERFRFEAQSIMRPCFCNRVTRAIIWAGGDESWKLEFPNRQDWFIFKELYKKCFERSARDHDRACLSSIIPVPRVSEVSGYAGQDYLPFKMPDSYISSRGDEVSRVLEKSDPVYEMDSDDDEWLNKFNGEGEIRVDEDDFEKIIDGFERGIYENPDDYCDVNSAVERCRVLGSKDVLEAVYGYWMDKRKKKRSALVRVFQFYKPKKAEQLNFKAVLRKKRSFRRRGNQAGRGKQITFLKAAFYEKNTAEEAQNATIKVEETEAAAKQAELAAIDKRQKAQLLMEIADLATYKAAMALQIAEARATIDDDIDRLLTGE